LPAFAGDDGLSEPPMQLEFRNNRDVWAGVMLIATGVVAVVMARNYNFGTALRMGPGYFPAVLGGLMVLFGLYLVAMGLRRNEKIEGNWSLRALVVLPLAMVLFGLLMEQAGFVPALMVLIVGSALASTEFRLLEVLLLAVGLTALAVALFIWGLGLPYPLIVGW
jgi:putative tricarboxylic transport membrane protein